ncbi:MAG: YHYH protein [Gammaproteobacteria bacterium]
MKIVKLFKMLPVLLLLFLTDYARSDTRDNAIALFQFAESNFPELLSPANPETQEIQGFYVRFYEQTGIYLGVQGDNVWALGGDLGEVPQMVGKLNSFITLQETDISDTLFTNRRALCTYYADDSFSAVRDIKRNILFNGDISISVEGNECVITTNNIPNHDFNDSSANFATDVAAVTTELRIPIEPAFASATTAISLSTDNGVLLNGVKIDLLAAACYNVGDEKIGCNDMNQPWRFDPMFSGNNFGTDMHNAHTQPSGAYHYHGNPEALFDQVANAESPLIGFAADGFPIFGSFIDDNGTVREVQSSYQLKSGNRPSSADDPGGNYDGTYVDDYEYVAGSGDLDECNGMMWKGSYGYYVINEYPWVLACYKGTPGSSFDKAAGGGEQGGQGGGSQGGMMPPPGGPGM